MNEHYHSERFDDSLDDSPQPTTMEPSHPDTLRDQTVDSVINYVEDWIGGNVNDDGSDSMAYTHMMRGQLDSLVAQERERWESELREKVEGLETISDGWNNGMVKRYQVLALISNKGKE